MSLINDALKQAGRAPKPAAAAAGSPAAPGPNLRPVEDGRPSRAGSVFLPLVLVVILSTAGWCFRVWWRSRLEASGFNLVTLVNSAKSLMPGSKPAANCQPVAADQSARANTAAGVKNAAASKPEGSNSEGNFITRAFNKQSATPAGAGSFPPVKVQGIYYRVGDSTVLINGKNLTEGEEINGVKIAKIDRQTVTLEFEGQTKEIKLH
ncbi:MAG TPA: general secretion pathway protein GspB [Verrucomicrobiae bacterium]|jgi:hypothetical protein